MCCLCASPDAITTVTAATVAMVAEMGFDSLVPLVGSTADGGPSVLFTFQIFPGRDWQYSTIDFDSPVNIPDDNVTIYYEDMNEVDPTDVIDWVAILDEILSDLGLDPLTPEEQAQPWEDTYDAYEDVLTGSGGGSTYTMEWDPSGMDEGDYSGGVTHSRWKSEPSDPENDPPDDEQELNSVFTVKGTGSGEDSLLIGFDPAAALTWTIEPGDTPDTKSFGIRRISGDASLYWKMSFTGSDWPVGAGLTMGTTEGTVYGPLLFNSIHSMTATLDATGMLDNKTYTGSITLQGFLDAGGVTATNEVTLGVTVVVKTSELEFLFTVGDQKRAVAFDIDILCVNKATRVAVAAYTDTVLTLVLNAHDGSDAMTPLTFDSTGLWDGAGGCTITARTITGGTGSDSGNTVAATSASGLVAGVSGEFTLTDSIIFAVSTPSSTWRDTDFSVGITATGNAVYVPVDNVYLTSDDDDDAITLPVSGIISNVGWVGGVKTVTSRVDGGSGENIIKLTVLDPISGRTGFNYITVSDAPAVPDPTLNDFMLNGYDIIWGACSKSGSTRLVACGASDWCSTQFCGDGSDSCEARHTNYIQLRRIGSEWRIRRYEYGSPQFPQAVLITSVGNEFDELAAWTGNVYFTFTSLIGVAKE